MLQLPPRLREALSTLPKATLPVLGVAALALCFGAGRCSAPTRTVTQVQEKLVYQDHIVEKRVEVKGDTIEKEKVKVEYLIQHLEPNGAQDTVRRTVTASESSEVLLRLDADEKQETKTVVQEKVVTKTVEVAGPNWRLGAFALARPLALTSPPSLGAMACRRVVGPVWLGLIGSTGGAGFSVGATLQVDF